MTEKLQCVILTAILVFLSIIAYRLSDKNSTDKQILSNVRDINIGAQMYSDWLRDIPKPLKIVEAPEMRR